MNKAIAAISVSLLVSFAHPSSLQAQQKPSLEISAYPSTGQVEYNLKDNTFVATNGIMVRFGDAVMTADQARGDQATGEVVAEGHVRVQSGELVWVGEKIRYNFFTHKMESEQFRTGQSPVFAGGDDLQGINLGGDVSNQVYTARNAMVTTDDIANPATRIRASSIKVVPNQYIEARHAVFYVGNVPVFYFPYFTQRLDGRANRFSFVPGSGSSYGPFLLSSYHWYLNDELDGVLHADYREKRGAAGGADFNLHLGRWGESSLRGYYLNDQDPTEGNAGYDIPNNRYVFNFNYLASPVTNLYVRSKINWQSDPQVEQNFFEGQYRANPQPPSFVEVNPLSGNWSLDLMVQPQVNNFLDTIERLPGVQLNGYQQPVFGSPLYYESASSVGYYEHALADSNGIPTGLDYAAPRADTFQQLTLPHTFFGWLNVAPRVGGRLSYYGEATGPGGTNDAVGRAVFNTGMEVQFKASQTWPGVTNRLLAMDGLRHIFEPSVNYAYVPTPSALPSQLPQFDYQLPSLRLLPIDYPDYNSIDSIDSQNVMRLSLRNWFQTKRRGKIENLFYWDLYTDWRLTPTAGQSTFAGLFSDFVFRPRQWLVLNSSMVYDIEGGALELAYHSIALVPNNTWSLSLGHLYTEPTSSSSITAGVNSSLTSTFFYRLNENWGFRMSHQYAVQQNWMQEQFYSIYRDFRNWTAALTVRLRDNQDSPDDVTFAFTFSLKAAPKYGVGQDAVNPASLLGY